MEKRGELHKLKLHKPQSDCQYKREKGSDLVIVTPIVATLTEEIKEKRVTVYNL